ARAAVQRAIISDCGKTPPPPRLWVFSIATTVVGGNTICPAGLQAARNSSPVNSPPCPITENCTPEFAAAAPDSCQTMCASSPTTTSSPGRVRILRPIWFAIVPLGTKRAASLPSSSAIRSSRRLTDGSSPYWSSPTGAAAIAWRMPGEGKVTVSGRRSMLLGKRIGDIPMKLYTYYRSQASFRVRIALNLKGLQREDAFLHLERGDQFAAEYRAINPQSVVPTLLDGGVKLFQSLAILEY